MPESPSNNSVNSTFSQSRNSAEWPFNSTRHFAQSISSNSIVFFNNEQQINRLKRLNRPTSRRIEQATRVIYRNITIPNELLRPVRVFHRPGENAPYIVELYVVTDEKFVSSFSHDVVRVVTRVNNIFKVVNSVSQQF
nr:subfamily M12B unassigned peptidase [Hymenolepis microstoma]